MRSRSEHKSLRLEFQIAFILVGWGQSFLSVAWPTGVQLVFFFLLRVPVSYSAPTDLYRRAAYFYFLP